MAELARNGFANIALVGQAVIDDALLNGGLAKDILAQRSAEGQPQTAPMGGGTLFQARATVFLPATTSVGAVRADLEKIADDLMVDFRLKPPV